MSYCANCGDEIKDPSQNFCEKCGSPIQIGEKRAEKAPTPTTPGSINTMGFQPYDRPGGLFDINRNYYILKEK